MARSSRRQTDKPSESVKNGQTRTRWVGISLLPGRADRRPALLQGVFVDKFIIGLIFVVGLIVLLAPLAGLVVMLLWNWLCPTIFHLPEITFWQAIGLLFLARAFFPVKWN